VNLKHRFNHKDQGGFPMPHKEGHLLIDGLKKQTLNIPLSIVKLLITINNLKSKAKSALEMLTKKTRNVPERPSNSFDLKIYGLKIVV
jgi:hypothetical protein